MRRSRTREVREYKRKETLSSAMRCIGIILYTKLVNLRDLRTFIRFMQLHNVARRDSEIHGIAHPGGRAFAFNERETLMRHGSYLTSEKYFVVINITYVTFTSAMMNVRLKIINDINRSRVRIFDSRRSSLLHFSTILIMHVAVIINMKMSVLIKAI